MAIYAINGTATPSVHGVSRNESISRPGVGKTRSEQAGGVAGADQFHLTPEALQLQELETRPGQQPRIESERVEALRKAIDSGTYRVNADRVAEKLLDLENKLFT